jgi:hypothetical protein
MALAFFQQKPIRKLNDLLQTLGRLVPAPDGPSEGAAAQTRLLVGTRGEAESVTRPVVLSLGRSPGRGRRTPVLVQEIVLAIEGLAAGAMAGDWGADGELLESWAGLSTEWIKQLFNDDLLLAVLHVGEGAARIHCLVLEAVYRQGLDPEAPPKAGGATAMFKAGYRRTMAALGLGGPRGGRAAAKGLSGPRPGAAASPALGRLADASAKAAVLERGEGRWSADAQAAAFGRTELAPPLDTALEPPSAKRAADSIVWEIGDSTSPAALAGDSPAEATEESRLLLGPWGRPIPGDGRSGGLAGGRLTLDDRGAFGLDDRLVAAVEGVALAFAGLASLGPAGGPKARPWAEGADDWPPEGLPGLGRALRVWLESGGDLETAGALPGRPDLG